MGEEKIKVFDNFCLRYLADLDLPKKRCTVLSFFLNFNAPAFFLSLFLCLELMNPQRNFHRVQERAHKRVSSREKLHSGRENGVL